MVWGELTGGCMFGSVVRAEKQRKLKQFHPRRSVGYVVRSLSMSLLWGFCRLQHFIIISESHTLCLWLLCTNSQKPWHCRNNSGQRDDCEGVKRGKDADVCHLRARIIFRFLGKSWSHLTRTELNERGDCAINISYRSLSCMKTLE